VFVIIKTPSLSFHETAWWVLDDLVGFGSFSVLTNIRKGVCILKIL